MKKIILILSIAAIGCNSSDTSEVGCNCNEVKDKKLTAHEFPTLYWEYELYVDYCNGSIGWVNVQQSVYNSINRGDCY